MNNRNNHPAVLPPTIMNRIAMLFAAAFGAFGIVAAVAMMVLFCYLTKCFEPLRIKEADNERNVIYTAGGLAGSLITERLLNLFHMLQLQEEELFSLMELNCTQATRLAYLRIWTISNVELASGLGDGITYSDLPENKPISQPYMSLTNSADLNTVRSAGDYYEYQTVMFRENTEQPMPVAYLVLGFYHNPTDMDITETLKQVLQGHVKLEDCPSKGVFINCFLQSESPLIQCCDAINDLNPIISDVQRSAVNLIYFTVFTHTGAPILSSLKTNLANFSRLETPTYPFTRVQLVERETCDNRNRNTDEYLVEVPVFHEANKVGTIQFYMSGLPQFLEPFQQNFSKIRILMMALLIGLTFLMMLTGIFIAIRFRKLVAEPIQKLAHAANNFEHSQYSDSTHLNQAEALAGMQHYTAETQQVASAYAHMVAIIQKALIAKDKAYETLKATRSKLITSEKQALIGTIASGVAHELKNALNPVRLRADRMLSAHRMKRSFDLEEGLSLIIKNVTRGAELAMKLNEFSKPVDWHSQHDYDLNAVIADTLIVTKDLLNEAEVKVVTELGDLPMLKGIAKELQQALVNFILNSKDAIEESTRDGRRGGHLWISTKHKNGQVEMEIADDGCGMDEKTSAQMFEPFFTTKEVGKGTGLGVGISLNILRAHSAEIQVESKLGQGTRITVMFPIIQHGSPLGTTKQGLYE